MGYFMKIRQNTGKGVMIPDLNRIVKEDISGDNIWVET